jgi:hypothetical protein
MKWLGEKPFHTLRLLTEKPAGLAAWQLLPIPLLLAGCAGLLWAAVVGTPIFGWIASLVLLLFALLDWALLASLPRWDVSFGPAQPPWLGLVFFRWLLSVGILPFASRWPVPTLIFLAIVQVLLFVLALLGTLIEPFRLQVTSLDITDAEAANPGVPLHIIHLSDLHIERLTRREFTLPLLVEGSSPDLIVLTGDFLSTTYNADPQALDDLRALLKELRAPGGIYAVWGTAEVDIPDLLRPVLTDLGIIVLEDQAIEVTVSGHRLWLVGLNCTRDLVAEGAKLSALMEDAPPDSFRLLLYHTPDLMPWAADLGVDLYLAGHTHGGQWRLPGFGALLTSSRYWKRYEAGHYHQGGTHLYVSRGLGMEGFGAPRARFFCPPEVVLIRVTGKGGDG